jgi:hypothetical protein
MVVLALAGVGVLGTTPGPASASASSVQCVTVLEGGDIGERFCVDESDCLLARYSTTFLGTERTCVVPRPGAGRSAAALRCAGVPGSKFCVDTEGSCTVFSYQSTPGGTAYYCYVRKP